jgi:hypothetical protein
VSEVCVRDDVLGHANKRRGHGQEHHKECRCEEPRTSESDEVSYESVDKPARV